MGSERITGIETFVRSWPMNFLIMDQIGICSFSGLKKGRAVLESVVT